MMVLAPSTKYFQNCTFSDWINQFLHIIGLENAKLDIFVPTRLEALEAWLEAPEAWGGTDVRTYVRTDVRTGQNPPIL